MHMELGYTIESGDAECLTQKPAQHVALIFSPHVHVAGWTICLDPALQAQSFDAFLAPLLISSVSLLLLSQLKASPTPKLPPFYSLFIFILLQVEPLRL